jgi:hypothetical protein
MASITLGINTYFRSITRVVGSQLADFTLTNRSFFASLVSFQGRK